ncbi:hypothetical protein Hdeb2414_s0013g00413381 [Helianthus debilis subsp. tardiflorus]
MVMDNGSVLTGCSTTCSGTPSETNKCFGINCCQTTIPDRFMSYSINLTRFETQGENGGCGSAALVDKTSYDEGRVSLRDATSIPVSLVWTLKLNETDQVTCCDNRTKIERKVALFNDTALDTWICYQPPVADNPYLEDGCEDKQCGKCTDGGGYCRYDTIYDVDGSLFSQNFTCVPVEKPKQSKRTMSLGVILGFLQFNSFIPKPQSASSAATH